MITIMDSTIAGNASQYGGAIYNVVSMLTINDSTLTGNRAQYGGGAIYLRYSRKYESDNCTFEDNKPDDVYEDEGLL